jgi:nucleoside-diphosphate-sugar epimerase
MPENRLAADLDHVLEHTRDLWDELRGERIFITGGTGFFGCWLLESFAWANARLGLGAKALVLTRNLPAFQKKAPHLAADPAIQLHPGDIRSFAFPQGSFSHIIHAATETNPEVNQINPLELFTANIDGTRHVLEFAVGCGAYKLLLTSSGAVYGKQPPEMTHIPEDYLGAPETIDTTTAYGQSKRACEFLFSAAGSSGLQAKIARCFAFVGPGLPLNTNYAIGNFIQDGLQGKPIHINGDGTPYRSYLYTADLAIWLWTILFNGKHARPYNVGSDADLTIVELAEEVTRTIAPHLKIEVARHPQPGQSVQRYVPSIRRATTELGVDVRVSLSDAIRRTADYYMGKV